MFIAIKSKDDCSEALEAARRYSPNIEIVDETTLVFDLTGSREKDAPKIAKQLREKFVSVAVSENLAAALLLARWGREEEFQVSGSRFQVGEEDRQRGGSASMRERGNAGQVSGSKFQVSSSKFKARMMDDDKNKTSPGKQTWNMEPETWNSPLSALPIAALAQRAEFLELMDSWAVHDLGSFARLPEDEMVARFGLEIVGFLKQARGEAFRAPGWNVKEDKFFWEKDLEGAIETIEPLNFVLSKGVEQIFKNLDYVGLSTQDAKITLKGREREKIYRIRLVFPTKNQKIWIRQIVTKIELDTPGFNIEHVEIEFRSTKPRIVQNNLYSGTILEPENLNLIVSKLKKVVGLEKIGLPKLRDSWSEEFYMTPNLSPLIEEKDSEFQVSGSRFQVEEEDSPRGGSASVRECGSAGQVSSSRFQVGGKGRPRNTRKRSGQWSVAGGEEVSTARGSERQSEPPAVAGGDFDKFKVQGSKFKVRNAEAKAKESSLSEQTPNSSDEVPGSRSQVSSSSKQTWNMEPETWNSPRPSPLVPCFFYLPHPVKARVFFESGEPKALIIKGKREMVRNAGGPWRMDAEWYRAKEWHRDEWDIETETGAVYRVFTDKNGEAFVDGGYD